MELRHLRYFVAVAESGGFTAAAERLHTVQPSLSRQIRDLEAYLGAALFERTSRHVSLTAAGQVFLDEARLTLAQADRAVERARQAARNQASQLVLGFVFGVEAGQLTRVMDVLGELEHVELAMHSQSSPALIAKLHERQIDAAFIRPSAQTLGLRTQLLRTEKLIVALPAAHPLAKKRSVYLAQLVEEPFINVTREQSPVLHATIEALLARHGVTLREVYQSENLMMALSLINSVGGVCLLPEHAVRLFPQGVVARPLAEESPTLELVLAWHPENPSLPLATFLNAFQRA
ncbi:LysR substrate-binding domain-containing protein [Serratia entomophila]|uniref:LysR substrate-binding domain-containing protein n=1 Tax=Serratia entomophila TaxID=42906 RepID=UPI0021791CFA|nr:LysR substrate-binding domain-containing protein [Serratia entomophila]CAI0774724.1 Hca operon transcriptional activator [Serratia entomophila]CAI1500518.1 Hca operon transcriptional activator [Serratia entomophila]CAI1509036.1 Hca operon transcriptional activator [Serratia entomophila]CAI1509137.1 Hca operon transcriptional activator [Serratia entomophila]CAI1611895.1 Hca operon transcriptional activator [Serratia entomophila]